MATTRSYGDHIHRRGNVYYFRQAIPSDLRERVGRAEVRVSLRTAYLREARAKAKAMAGAGVYVFNQIRQDGNMDKREIDRIIREQFHKFLGQCEDEMLASGPTTLHEVMKSLSKFDKIKQGIQWNLMTRDFGWIGANAHSLAEEHGIDTDENSLEYRKLAFEMLRAYKDVVDILQHRMQGNFDHEVPVMEKYKLDVASVSPPAAVEGPKKDDGIIFSQLVDRYCEYKIAIGKWSERGITENPKKFNIIKLILGDIPVRSITAEDAMRVLNKLQQLPPRADVERYRGMTANEIIATNPPKKLAIKSINDRMNMLAGLFKFAVKNDYADKNYFAEMQIKDPEGDNEKRKVFSEADLKRVFAPDSFLPYCNGDPARYWIPVLALYTGARIEEIAQLEVCDVYVEVGVLVIDINDSGEKRLKTPSSKRKVPVHEVVKKELGFEFYVKELQRQGETRLFPALRRVNSRYGHKPSRDFGRYIKGLELGPGKTFHSFRHTFIHHLQNKRVEDKLIASATGHKQLDKGPIPANYNHQHYMQLLVEEVLAKVSYEVRIPCLS